MDLSTLSQKELQARCAYCHQIVPEDQECFGVGARARSEMRGPLRAYQGQLVPLAVGSGRELIAIVLPADAPARREGYDLYFKGCSEECLRTLREELGRGLSGTA
jgi:hypothetical protein